MSVINSSVLLKSMTHNGSKVKKWIHNGAQVFSAGGIVTYIVDIETSYTEEVESGASCLAPTTFTPSKSGWKFIGWREDTVASGEVLKSKVMESSSITLYAVYQKVVTLSYNGNGAQSGSMASQNGTRIYNAAGNYSDPTFMLAGNGFTRSDYNFTGWDLGTAGTSVTLSANTTAYAQWTRIPAEAFYLHTDVLGLSGQITELGYGDLLVAHNPTSEQAWWTVRVSHNGAVAFSYATMEIANVKRMHCTKVKFQCYVNDSGGTIDIGGVTHSLVSGENIIDISSLTADVISVKLHTGASPNEHGVQITAPYFYGDDAEEETPAEYTVTYVVDEGVSYQEDVAVGVSCLNPTSFTPSKEGWEFIGWKEDKNADTNVLTNKMMSTEPITLYAVYETLISETFVGYNGSEKDYTASSKEAYYNSAGVTAYPYFTAPGATEYPGMVFDGWSAPDDSGINVDVIRGETYQSTSSCDRFGIYSREVSITYDGNGSTGGSTNKQIEKVYHNISANEIIPSVVISKNGFTKTGYSFNGWTDGRNTYTEGQIVPLTYEMVLLAMWEADVVAEPYSVYLKSGVFVTEGDCEDYYSDLQVFEGQAVIWEFANDTAGTGRIMAYGLETKGCNRVWIYLASTPSMSEYTLVGATNVYKNNDGNYLYGTVSGTTVDIGISVTVPNGMEMFDSLTIENVRFYSE